MAKWEIAIATKDEADLESGHKRKKEGDIIAIVPYPHNWGTEEIKRYLIVVVDGLSEEDVNRMVSPLYPEGKYQNELVENLTEELTPEQQTINAIMRIPIAKRRSNIPLQIIKDGWYPNLDLNRVADYSDAYQPLKDNNIVIDTSEKVAIAKDKFRNSFKYKAKKVI